MSNEPLALGENIPWGEILPDLFALVRESLERTRPSVVRNELSRGSFRVASRVRRMYRKKGYRGKDLRFLVNDTMLELRNSTASDIDDLIAEATEDTEETNRV